MSIWASVDDVTTLDGGDLDVAVTAWLHPKTDGRAIRLCMLDESGAPWVDLDLDQARRLRDILVGQIDRLERRGPA